MSQTETTERTPIQETVTPPLPSAPYALFALNAVQTFLLGGIFLFCLLAACYFAANILLPIFLALLLKFVLHPVIRAGQRWRIPSSISSIMVIAVLFLGITGLGVAISEPIGQWSGRLQDALPHFREQLDSLKNHITGMQQALSDAEHIVPGADTKTMIVAVRGTTLSDRLLSSGGRIISGMFETIIVLLFLLISGDTFLRRLVEVLPRFKDKKHAVAISQQIENDLSAYLLTITGANLAVGLATGLAMRFCNIDDPLLWGLLAFALNYVPIIGPILMLGIVFLIGCLSSIAGFNFLPAVIFLFIHLLESQIVTPLLLARRFTLNPVLIILSLTFWFWMWGIVGAILATPMLAVAKIICDRIEPLQPLGHLIEGGSKPIEKAV